MNGELRELLKSVPDSYDDFVQGTASMLKKSESAQEKMIQYLKENPDSQTDDVLDYLDELLGL